MAEATPKFFGEMRNQRCCHQHHGLGHRARCPPTRLARFGHMVHQFDEFCDGGVEPQSGHLGAHHVDRAVQKSGGLVVGRAVVHGEFAGVLVDHGAPEPLQEAEHADHVACFPRSARIEGAHRHLVQPQRVRAIGVVHLVGRHGIAQALAHLSPLAGHRGAVVGEAAVVVLDDLGGIHVDAAVIGEGVRQDVALIEQPRIGLTRRHMAEVEQHLVPETRVQQVQHGVLHAADIQIDTAGMIGADVGAGAHPVVLDRRIDKGVGVGRVEIAQLVPTRPGPLGHHVGIAPVRPGAIAEVQRDLDPLAEAIEWAFRLREFVVGVEGAWRERVGFREGDRQHLVGKGVRVAIGVVHDGERLAPVALTAE